MSIFEQQPVVGLFGTCGNSTFRQELFIPEYKLRGIDYFNPQVDDWRPELAEIEADHLVYDTVQCWPVLGSTYGTGSLAETGYSIVGSLSAASPLPKFILPFIELELVEALDDNTARDESIRSRHLVAAHLKNINAPNVFLMGSLEEMLDTSIVLHGVAKALVEIMSDKSPAYKRFVDLLKGKQIIAEQMRSGNLGKAAKQLLE